MIGSSENRISYNGNGIATEFAYTFKILEKSNLKVLHVAADGTEELLTTDYYVDMEKSVVLYPGYAPGAEIPEQNRPPILPVGERLVLYREVPITQESALDKHWPFNVIENGLDKLTIICQQIWDRLQRSFYVSESTSTNFDPKVPIEAGKTFRVKDDGTGFEVTEDPGKVIDGAKALLKQTTEQAESANEAATTAQNAATHAEVQANKAENIVVSLPNNWQDTVDNAFLAKLKTDGFVTPQMFKTDENTWDNAITQAINVANTQGKVLYFPIGDYPVENGVVVDVPIDVIMDGTLIYNGEGIALTIGNANANIFDKTYKVRVRTEQFKDNKNSHGVKFVNISSCIVTIAYVNNFYNNVLLYADNGKGCCHNKVYFGHIMSHKYGITLSENNNGWTNENSFFGGRIHNTSSDKYYKNDVAIWLTSDRNYNKNNNVFYHPCFEGSHIGIKIDYGIYNYFYDCRAEDVGTTLYAENGAASRNRVTIGYGEENKFSNAINYVEKANNKETVYSNTIYDSGNLYGKVVALSSNQALVDELYLLNVSTMDKTNTTASIPSIDGIGSTSSAILGLLVDTTNFKQFCYKLQGDSQFKYRVLIVQFDASGNKLESAEDAPFNIVKPMVISTNYQNSQIRSDVWTEGVDQTDTYREIILSPRCAKAYIAIAIRGEGKLQRFKLLSEAPATYEKRLPYLAYATIPTGQGFYDGQRVNSSAPTADCLGWIWYNGQWNVFK